MDKQIQFQGQTEMGIFCQSLFGSSGAFEKQAGAPPFADWETGDALRKYISKLTKEDRKKHVYVLVNALGAGEYFGSNINADFFPWNALAHEGNDYGYKTFETFAHAYQHHKNKDPTRAFGVPVLSVLNHPMKRVELIVRLDRAKAKEEQADGIITRIEGGEFPDVSMGCFMAGTLVTMADGTRKPIELIQVGDAVITHTGQVKKVTETHRRQYKGSIYTLKAEGHRPVRGTRQHPWGTFLESEVKKKDEHANLQWRKDAKISSVFSWTEAECLDDAPHYLAEPVLKVDESVSPFVVQPSRAQARILGYYLAEGHLLRDKKGELCGIELTTNRDDAVHGEIDALCEELGTKNKPVTFDRVNSETSQGIWVFDEKLAHYCFLMAGQYSKEKRLSKDVLHWRPEFQRELLGAYANGDGCGPDDGSLKLSTSSESLAHQWLVILPRLGIIPSMGILNHKAGTSITGIDSTEFVVHIGKQWAQKLRDVCAKVQRVEIEKTKLSRNLMDGYIVTPIRELDSMYVETEVFNFEVEGDNSYLVEGLAVHNCKVPFDVCSICGQKSKTRFDYCQHMMPPPELRSVYGPNKILPDGRRIYVINTQPKFFDISFVFIGADKTAKVMAKVASRGDVICLGDVCAVPSLSTHVQEVTAGNSPSLAGMFKAASATCACGCGSCDPFEKLAEGFSVKTSEIVKQVPAGHFTQKVLPALEASEPDIKSETLDEMAEKSPLKEIVGNSMGLGIVLKPHEFQRIVLIRMGERDFADELDSSNGVFRRVDGVNSMLDADPSVHGSRLLELLKPYLSSRSGFGEPLKHRSVKVSVEKIPLPTRKPIEHPLLDKVSAAYNGYRQNIMTKISKVEAVVESDPTLREQVYGVRLSSLFDKTATTASILSPDSVTYLQGAYTER